MVIIHSNGLPDLMGKSIFDQRRFNWEKIRRKIYFFCVLIHSKIHITDKKSDYSDIQQHPQSNQMNSKILIGNYKLGFCGSFSSNLTQNGIDFD